VASWISPFVTKWGRSWASRSEGSAVVPNRRGAGTGRPGPHAYAERPAKWLGVGLGGEQRGAGRGGVRYGGVGGAGLDALGVLVDRDGGDHVGDGGVPEGFAALSRSLPDR